MADDGSDRAKQRVDEAASAFERDWGPGGLEAAIAGLADLPQAARKSAIDRLVAIDLKRRWASGEKKGLEDYLPLLGGRDEVDPKLVHLEWQLRRQHGAASSVEDLQARFPRQVSGMRRAVLKPQNAETSQIRKESLRPSGSAAAADTPVTWRPLESGEMLDRFQIVGRIGGGGMGDVYRATDTTLEREVAIKVPRLSPHDGAEILRRFLSEAKVVAKLSHPNLCPVYNVGEDRGLHWFAMRYVEGENLAELLKTSEAARSPFSAEMSVRIVATIAEALEHAHESGVLHRDLKPGNIMFDPRSGEPIVMDFGLALPTRSNDARLTGSGTALGTPAYMPLEQANGDLARIGPRSDVYSLGAVLYEMLTGRPPVQGSYAQMMAELVAGTPTPPSKVRPVSDPALDAICLKALAQRPEDRYPSMSAFAEALRRWSRNRQSGKGGLIELRVDSKPKPARAIAVAPVSVAGSPKPMANTSGSVPAHRRSKQTRVMRPLYAGGTTVAAIACVVLAWMNTNGFLEGEDASSTAVAIGADREFAPRGSDPAVERAIARVADPASPATPKPAEQAAGFALTFPLAAALPAPTVVPTDGVPLLLEKTLADPEGPISRLAFAPDGSSLASGGKTVRIWDVTAGQEVRELSIGRRFVWSLSYSPDGKHLAAACSFDKLPGETDPEIVLWDTASWSARRFDGGDTLFITAAFLPDSSAITACGRPLTPFSYKVSDGSLRSLPEFPKGSYPVFWADDERTFMRQTVDKSLFLWDVETGARSVPYKGIKTMVAWAAVSPDRSRIVACSPEGSLQSWNVSTGDSVFRSTEAAGKPRYLRYLPDGKRFAVGWEDGALTLHHANSGSETSRVAAHTSALYGIAFSPVTNLLATGGKDGKIHLWRYDAERPAEKSVAPPSGSDGEWIALFDGTDVSRWETLGAFRVEDGLLINKGIRGSAITRDEFADFELELEWKLSERGDSGVAYRMGLENGKPVHWREYALLDPKPFNLSDRSTAATGGLWGILGPTKDVARPLGEWNTTRIICRDTAVEHWLNGERVLAYDTSTQAWRRALQASPMAPSDPVAPARQQGRILLQDMAGEVAFRNVRIRGF